MLRLLLCPGDAETASGRGFAVFLPDFGKILAECGGVDAGGSDGLPSDLEGSCRDCVSVVLGHVGLEFVLDGFDFCVEVVGHLAEFGQFVQFRDDFVLLVMDIWKEGLFNAVQHFS